MLIDNLYLSYICNYLRDGADRNKVPIYRLCLLHVTPKIYGDNCMTKNLKITAVQTAFYHGGSMNKLPQHIHKSSHFGNARTHIFSIINTFLYSAFEQIIIKFCNSMPYQDALRHPSPGRRYNIQVGHIRVENNSPRC